LTKVNKWFILVNENKKGGGAMERTMERQESQGRERVYDSVIALRVSQTMARVLKEKAREYGLNVSDFLRLKLIEILQKELKELSKAE